MKRPAASVVIGVYNRAAQIGACLDSLLASTTSDFEVVLVEDGSSDGSGEVLEAYRRAHPDRKIEVVHNARNRGASGARNVGMDHASGEFLLFTDSDCIVEPTWIERMVEGMRGSGAGAVSGTVLDKRPENLAERAYVGSCLVTRKTPNLMESNMGLRADLGFRFDEAIFYGEGDDLATRLRSAGHGVALVPGAVVHHHHGMRFRGYMRMARVAGRGHALFWYKHGRFMGRDILAASLAILSAPLALLDARLLSIPVALLALQLAAILFNEIHYKGKPPREALTVLPVAVCYYGVRTFTALRTWASAALGGEPGIQESRRRWRATRGSSARSRAT